MVDNVTADPGAGGATFATDDDGTAHHPYVKLEFGADNTQTKVSSTNPLPVNWAGTNPPIGAGTEAAALRVTVATDSTGVLSVDDNGGSLTVDVGTALPAGTNVIGTVDLDVMGTGATKVGKTVDTAAGATDRGIAPVAIRDDALGALTPIEGDYVNLRTDANGALWTHDDALDAALAGSELQVDVVAALPAGTNAIGKLAANSGVDIGDVDVTSVIPGTGATNLGKAVDTAGGATDTGVATLAIRDDALGALTPIEGDYINLRVDANGALWTHDDALDAALAGSELQVDVVAALPAGTNAIGKLAANSGVDIGDVDVLSIAAGDNNIGNVDIASAIPAGTNNIGDVDVLSIAAGTTLIGDVGISGARTSGGTTIFRSLDIDETEEEIKATAGQVYWIHAMNVATAVRYLKFYNATAATVVVGTTTPVLTFPIPTQAATASGAGFVLSIPNGIAFGTAITVAATTGVADADTGAPGANDVIINIGFA